MVNEHGIALSFTKILGALCRESDEGFFFTMWYLFTRRHLKIQKCQ